MIDVTRGKKETNSTKLMKTNRIVKCSKFIISVHIYFYFSHINNIRHVFNIAFGENVISFNILFVSDSDFVI